MSGTARRGIINYEIGGVAKDERIALKALAAEQLGPHAVRVGRRRGIFGIQDPKIPAWQGEHNPDQLSPQEIDGVVAGQAPVSASTSAEAGTVVYDPQQVMIARSEIDAFYAESNAH